MTRVVTSEEVAAYQGLVDRLARKNDGRGGAEYDDLYQEGLIAVFTSLRDGNPISAEFIQWRMSNWVRLLRKQSRREPTDYDELLPIAEEPGVPREGSGIAGAGVSGTPAAEGTSAVPLGTAHRHRPGTGNAAPDRTTSGPAVWAGGFDPISELTARGMGAQHPVRPLLERNQPNDGVPEPFDPHGWPVE